MQNIKGEHAAASSPSRTTIDDHPKTAGLFLLANLLPIGVYAEACDDFHISDFPWKALVGFAVLSAALIVVQSFMNRRTKRLIWEGVAVSIAFCQVWVVIGSYGYFYLIFAPMNAWLRTLALATYLIGTAAWICLSWRNYRKATSQLDLIERCYAIHADSTIFSISNAEKILCQVKTPGPSIYLSYWVFAILGPLIIGFSFVSARSASQTGGPHLTFVILTILGFPLSCWTLGQLVLRFVYFHIFLPIWLERRTGKRVILAP